MVKQKPSGSASRPVLLPHVGQGNSSPLQKEGHTTLPLAIRMEQKLCRCRTTSDSLAPPLGEDSSSNDKRPSLPLERLKSNSS